MQEYLRQLKIYIKDIAKLALPITTAFVAMGLMGIIDTMIVGNYNTDQLAYIGLANSIFVVLFTIPIGLLQGVLIKSSQKFGAHKFQSTGKIYNEGRKYSFILAIVFTLLGIQGETILRLLGQDDDMVKHGGEVLRVFVFSIPFILMYVNANFSFSPSAARMSACTALLRPTFSISSSTRFWYTANSVFPSWVPSGRPLRH